MAEAEANARKLTDEEILLIEYYCREVLKKVVKRPPPQQQQDSSATRQHSNLPHSDPKKQAISPSASAKNLKQNSFHCVISRWEL